LQIPASVPIARHRLLDPAKVFVRAGLILCGVAVTWMCAAFGLLASEMVFGRPGCRLRVKPAVLQVRDIASAISQYMIDQNRCPRTKDDLIDNQYVVRKTFEDPWGTTITFTCPDGPDDEVRVRSAGPDHIFGTNDDVTNW